MSKSGSTAKNPRHNKHPAFLAKAFRADGVAAGEALAGVAKKRSA